MDVAQVREHWEQRWGDHAHEEMGWFQSEPEPSLELVTRLGERAGDVTWVQGDVTEVRLGRTFDTWHDRAVLHFLVEEDDRAAYVATLREHLVTGGHAVIGTFSPAGPDSCSGLPVRRHSADDLQQLVGLGFRLLEDRAVTHTKPSGDEQAFTFVVLRREA